MTKRQTYKWHEMPGPEVAELAKETDVALLPVGCVEMHGPHLPTGTDAIRAEGIAEMVAEREPAIILPTLYLNLNDQMKCYPGTIAISPEVVASIYRELCGEAARNGFNKIVLLVAHGGVNAGHEFVQHSLLHEGVKGYSLFTIYLGQFRELASDVLESPVREGHGGEGESSAVAYFRPDLVHLDRLEPLPEGEGPYYEQTVTNARYMIDWIRQVPKGYVGRPHLAAAEKGARIAEVTADECAKIIRQIKSYDPKRDR